MNTMTLEQVRDWHYEIFKSTNDPKHKAASDAIDAHLAAQAEWPSEEDVEIAARAAWNHVPRGRSWEELTKEGRDSWKEDTRASLQSVRPPVGVVSDEDVHEAVEAYVVSDKNADSPRFEAMRAALESYASRHAPTKD